MEEFLNKMYNYEYFGFYLILSIIILVILFLIILFMGKKDKKTREIEATKKLQQLNIDAFKEEDNKEIVEIKNEEQNKLENDTIIVPSIEEVPILDNVEENNIIPEPILPIENVVSENIVLADSNKDTNEKSNVISEELDEPILQRIEEKPLAFDNTMSFNELYNIKEEPVVESNKEDIEIPIQREQTPISEIKLEDNVKEETPKYNRGPQIFSSVYVPKQKEIIEENHLEEVPSFEEFELELPKLKRVETKKEEIQKIDSNEESQNVQQELSKDDEIIEKPILTDYNLDNLSGETYTIKY